MDTKNVSETLLVKICAALVDNLLFQLTLLEIINQN